MNKKLDVPYVKQISNYGGPACLEMVLKYHGLDKTQFEIGSEISPIPYFGYTVGDIANYAKNHGFCVDINEHSSIDRLIRNIDQGLPTIILQKLTIQNNQPHFRVAIGYHNRRISIHDPELFDDVSLPETSFNYIWDLNGRNIAITLKK